MKSVEKRRTSYPVRLKNDLAEKLSAIRWFRRDVQNIPDLLDPLIRPTVEKLFAGLPADVRKETLRRIEAGK